MAAVVTKSTALSTLRQLLSEIRVQSSTGKLKENIAAKYLLNQYRKYQTTDEQLCKAREEVLYVTNTYLCYLKSTRKYQEINAEFSGRGERSVQETANLVGFKLPHDPK